MIPNDTDFESKVTLESENAGTIAEPPFHILLLGDWSGSGNKSDLSQRRPIAIDRDNFDDVMRKLNVRIDLDLSGDGKDLLPLRFTELEDFHPDRIFQQISLFSNLRDVRRRLLSPDTFNEAAKEVSSWHGIADSKKIQEEAVAKRTSQETSFVDSANLLDKILSKPGEPTISKPQLAEKTDLSELLGKLVKPYLVEIDESEQAKLIAAVDEATGDLMRLILHNNSFQDLEAAWRGLYFLIRKVETDVDLKIHLLDASKDEIADNLKSVNNLTDSYLYKWLIQETIETPGGEPWAVIGGNYAFGLNIDDIAMLIRVGKLANNANAPFISYLKPEAPNISSTAKYPNPESWSFLYKSTEGKLWTTLRTLPESAYLGLVIPRFLARLPYGNKTEPLESFSFEEFSALPSHDDYLWANPSFVCLLLLAQSYRSNGWEMERFYQDIEGLPIHFYQEGDETVTKSCVEVIMTVNACEEILKQGLMPLISFKNSDRIRLARLQSISSPLMALRGRWDS